MTSIRQPDRQIIERLRQLSDHESGISNGKRIVKRINSCSDPEQVLDYVAEARFGLIFRQWGFRVRVEPTGAKGPDLLIEEHDEQAYVEVKRFRRMMTGPLPLDLTVENPILPVYGNIPRDLRKALQAIQAKAHQFDSGPTILAIWNDDLELEDIEVCQVARDLLRRDHGSADKSGLALILFLGHDGTHGCWRTRNPAPSIVVAVERIYSGHFWQPSDITTP